MNWQDPWSSLLTSELWDPYNSNWNIARRHGDRDDITSSLVHAHVNCHETETTHIFSLDLPGVKKEDLKVEMEEESKILQIRGEKVKEKDDQNDNWHRTERQYGTFLRRFRLPEDADPDGIGCKLENGVLTVTIPKVTKTENNNVRKIDVA